jgi:hypothetical protein
MVYSTKQRIPREDQTVNRYFRLLVLGALLGLNFNAHAADPSTPQIWLSGDDPVVQQQKHKDNPADYMDLFKSTTAWPQAASHVKVFKISTQMALHGTDEQLKIIIGGLKREHILMGIEAGLLVATKRCGKGAEGYGLPATVETFAKRIQSLGGSLDYVAMDEPVWFGHAQGGVVRGVVRCQDSLADLVDQIAPKIAILRLYFPNVQIGDIDPINASPYATSQDPRFVGDIIALTDLLQQKTGMKLAFVHADIAWTTKWQPMVESLASQLHKRGIRFGVICDGGGPDVNSNEAWVRQALQRCRAMAANPKTLPDDLIVQSWEPLPTKMLPETDPGSLTYEANQLTSLIH